LIQGAIEEIDPVGRTPLTAAVATAAEVLGKGRRRGLIVLVTDGEENCGGDPCLFGRQVQAAGNLLKVHVIGYRLRVPEASALGCLALSTGGLLVEASSADELASALQSTFGCLPISRAPGQSVLVRNGR
jgi:Ca-activated chloride channel family protein